MKIGFCVEGPTDEALLTGLRNRWCPDAILVAGHFRGQHFRRRDIPTACIELCYKGADLIILLRDANDENWREVGKDDLAACAKNHRHLVVIGICERNVECWLVANPMYASEKTGVPIKDFQVADPKRVFEYAMHITSLDRQSNKIAEYVCSAPLKTWLGNESFDDFYMKLRRKSIELQCNLENLRDAND